MRDLLRAAPQERRGRAPAGATAAAPRAARARIVLPLGVGGRAAAVCCQPRTAGGERSYRRRATGHHARPYRRRARHGQRRRRRTCRAAARRDDRALAPRQRRQPGAEPTAIAAVGDRRATHELRPARPHHRDRPEALRDAGIPGPAAASDERDGPDDGRDRGRHRSHPRRRPHHRRRRRPVRASAGPAADRDHRLRADVAREHGDEPHHVPLLPFHDAQRAPAQLRVQPLHAARVREGDPRLRAGGLSPRPLRAPFQPAARGAAQEPEQARALPGAEQRRVRTRHGAHLRRARVPRHRPSHRRGGGGRRGRREPAAERPAQRDRAEHVAAVRGQPVPRGLGGVQRARAGAPAERARVKGRRSSGSRSTT